MHCWNSAKRLEQVLYMGHSDTMLNTRNDWKWAAATLALCAVGCLAPDEGVELWDGEVIAVDPEPEMEAFVQRAIDSWHEAGGPRFEIAAGGVPIVWGRPSDEPDLVRANDGTVLAGTVVYLGEFGSNPLVVRRVVLNIHEVFDRRGEALQKYVAHELGHLAGAGHTDTGLMAQPSESRIPTDVDVLEACNGWGGCHD
jgi:hypothetical protein